MRERLKDKYINKFEVEPKRTEGKWPLEVVSSTIILSTDWDVDVSEVTAQRWGEQKGLVVSSSPTYGS